MVPKVGFEPTRGCPHRFLRPARLPFRHFGLYLFYTGKEEIPTLIIAQRSSHSTCKLYLKPRRRPLIFRTEPASRRPNHLVSYLSKILEAKPCPSLPW